MTIVWSINLAEIAAFIVALLGLGIACFQLGSIKRQLELAVKNQKNDGLKVVLEIETQLNQRKLEYDKANKAIRLSAEKDISAETLEVLEDYSDTTRESYLNTLDRLCYCIIQGYLEDKDWRTEYRNMLYDTVVAYPDEFAEESPYRNIKKLNEKWQSE